MKTAAIAIAALVATASTTARAHDVIDPRATPPGPVMSDEELYKAFGWDFEATDIRTEKVADNLYVLFGIGGNIAASVGKDGTLIVDDQFPQLMPKIEAALRAVGSERVDFVVNTHWHFDHAAGNLALGEDGASWIVSHSNSRAMMTGDRNINFGAFSYDQKAYPEHARSDITFDSTMQFHLNGQRIELIHAGPAHTDGDAAVLFRGSDAVHMGDVFNNAGFPFIDADNGGSLSGMIAFCQQVHDAIGDATKVIPGHGPVTTRAKLARYIAALSAMRDEIAALVGERKTLEEVIAARPTARFDAEFGANDLTRAMFVSRAYASLLPR